ncbi:MAG: IS110 family transposase, partial [Clostridia bacterium]|nr:IS110 family transposase [Clostridia bacterium]
MENKRSLTQSDFQIVHPNAAGIDVASQMHYVAVPPSRDQPSVRKFGSFTQDLHDLARWLKKCQIDTVAMESTGIYWIQLYLILEEYGFEVFLVNARHIKNVSGRKSDVQDCQWIQQLHSFGLLNASFQPDLYGRELRTYMRHRKSLTESYAIQVQHMQKAFEQMNIKLSNVLSDITGKSGMAIIEAILSGERNASKLSDLADPHVKASKTDIIKSLQGVWREEHLFELRQAYDLYKIFKQKIRECDIQIERTLQKHQQISDDQHHPPARKARGNNFEFNVSSYLKKILGVDITEIFGISEVSAMQIISEIGIDMSKWPTPKHFVAWLNLAPNNRISGGKLLKPKRDRKKNKAGQFFRMAAFTLQRSNHWLGITYRRIASKKGAPVAVKAVARKLAIIVYQMIKQNIEFNPVPIETYNQLFKERKLKYIKNQA